MHLKPTGDAVVDYSRLRRNSGAANEGNGLAGLHVDVDALEHPGLVLAITKPHAFIPDRADRRSG